MTYSDFIYRNLDASLNRASEGLRVLMDLARFGLDAEPYSESLKSIRHELIQLLGRGDSAARLVSARDSQGDVSRPSTDSSLPPAYRDSMDLSEANFRRVEEALRSIEETLRLVDPEKARSTEFLRYRLYDIQKELLSPLLEQSLRNRMDFDLYVVTDSRISRGRPLEWVVREAIRGGAGAIQLREKHSDIRAVLDQARLLRKVTRDEGATFIVNDHIEVALEVEADGVHLGQDDLPLDVARRITAGRMLIGISTHNREQALAAQSGGAGYINMGPVFPTQTKDTPVLPVTVDLIREMVPHLSVPFTTMGGISLDNVAEVISAGADRAAVVSAVVGAEDVAGAARALVDAIRRAKEERESARA